MCEEHLIDNVSALLLALTKMRTAKTLNIVVRVLDKVIYQDGSKGKKNVISLSNRKEVAAYP